MKKQLPQTNEKGFTLVELLVVISIIAILAVVGLTIFTSTQKNARDARRRADVDAIANALEVGKAINTSTYATPALSSSFAGSVFPTDPTTGQNYCIGYSATAGAVAPSNPATWLPGAACSAMTGAVTTGVVNNTYPPAGATSWNVCASLEGTATVYCKPSVQ